MDTPQGHTRQCTAKSTRSGERCKRWAIVGGTVCPFHGGSAPQVKRSAEARIAEVRDRLLDLADPAVSRLAALLESEDEGVVLRALVQVLDRAGVPAVARTELTGADGEPLDRSEQARRIAEELAAFQAGMETQQQVDAAKEQQ